MGKDELQASPDAGTSRLAALAAQDYANDFRRAAARWRQVSEPLDDSDLGTECGRLVIEADELGYLPAIPELRELIEWHTGDGSEDRKPGMQAVRVRCPYNLFLDIAGGHLVHVRNEGGRLAVVEDPNRGTALHGGLIPGFRPAALRMSGGERKALACEWLARLIEDHSPDREPEAPDHPTGRAMSAESPPEAKPNRPHPGARAVAAAYHLAEEGKPVSLKAACELAGVDRKHVRNRYPESAEVIRKMSTPDRAKPRGFITQPRGSADRRARAIEAVDEADD